MPHGHHIYTKSYDMTKATMYSNSQSDHDLPKWKFVFQCCAQCPSINIPDQKTYDKYSNQSTSIRFHIYHLIAHCTKHGRLPLPEKKIVESVNSILLQENQQKYTLKKS